MLNSAIQVIISIFIIPSIHQSQDQAEETQTPTLEVNHGAFLLDTVCYPEIALKSRDFATTIHR